MVAVVVVLKFPPIGVAAAAAVVRVCLRFALLVMEAEDILAIGLGCDRTYVTLRAVLARGRAPGRFIVTLDSIKLSRPGLASSIYGIYA